MVSFLGLRDSDAEANFHLFVFAVYLTPLVGAWLADRFFGRYRVILWLSLGYVFGHASIALFESDWGLLLGLSLIAAGSRGHQAVRGGLRRRPVHHGEAAPHPEGVRPVLLDDQPGLVRLHAPHPRTPGAPRPSRRLRRPRPPHGVRAARLLVGASPLREPAAHGPEPERLLPRGPVRPRPDRHRATGRALARRGPQALLGGGGGGGEGGLPHRRGLRSDRAVLVALLPVRLVLGPAGRPDEPRRPRLRGEGVADVVPERHLRAPHHPHLRRLALSAAGTPRASRWSR